MWKLSLGSSFLVVLLAGVTMAQVAPPSALPAQTPNAAQSVPGTAGPASQVDSHLSQHLAACLILGNHEEVALGQFAAQRSQNSDVKQFAQSMVNDHTQAIAKLEPFAPFTLRRTMHAQAQTAPMQQRSATQPREHTVFRSTEGAADPGSSSARSTTASPMAENAARTSTPSLLGTLFQIDQSATNNAIALTEQDLSQKKGADFDKGYIGQLIVGHTIMLAKLKAAEPYASGELRQVVQQLEPEVVKHLTHAKDIMKSLEK